MRVNMSEQLASLANEVVASIKGINIQNLRDKGDGAWTVAIKGALIDLGQKHDYQICTSSFPDECESEWLYDLVWYRKAPSGHLREIGLILESEWAKKVKGIQDDFEKLLVAKCPIKVMVFQDFKDTTVEQIWSLLETGIRTFESEPTKDRYILVGFNNGKHEFEIKTVTA